MLPLLLIIIACFLWAGEIKEFIQEKWSDALDAVEDVTVALTLYREKIERLQNRLVKAEERIEEKHNQVRRRDNQILELRKKHKEEVELLSEQIRSDFQTNHQKFRQALRINNESLEQVLADRDDIRAHVEELKKEKTLIQEHRDLVQKHCDEAWEHFNRACKLAEFKDNEIQRLNSEIRDLTERLVAYENNL